MDDRELLLKLGNKIRYERVRRHLSQEKLAELAKNIPAPGTGDYIVRLHANRTPIVVTYEKQ